LNFVGWISAAHPPHCRERLEYQIFQSVAFYITGFRVLRWMRYAYPPYSANPLQLITASFISHIAEHRLYPYDDDISNTH
jgi:hypothetical protein